MLITYLLFIAFQLDPQWTGEKEEGGLAQKMGGGDCLSNCLVQRCVVVSSRPTGTRRPPLKTWWQTKQRSLSVDRLLVTGRC